MVVCTYWQDYEVDGGGLQRHLTATVRDAQGGSVVTLARKFTPRTDNFLLQAEVAQYVQASQDTEPPPGVLPKRSKEGTNARGERVRFKEIHVRPCFV